MKPKVPRRYRRYWNEPWLRRAKLHPGFRAWLNKHGYLTPHFRIAEAACKDGTPVTGKLKTNARNHAFNLERLRHRLGDRSIPVISWYRTPAYNAKVGGASKSQHMRAVATDHPKNWVDKRGRNKVIHHAGIVFKEDGLGVYPGGSVHFDSRGWRARWSSWSR